MRSLATTMFVVLQLGISAATLKLEQLGPPIPSQFERGSMAYGSGAFVMLAGQTILYSTNAGLSWLDAKVPISDYGFVKYVNGYFFAGTYSKLLISQDGMHWRSKEFTMNPTDVAFGDDRFVAVGHNVRAFSIDTFSWTEVSVSASPTTMFCLVAYGNGMFVAAEKNGDGSTLNMPVIDTSADGLVWTRLNLPSIKVDPNCTAALCDTVKELHGLIFLNGKFTAYGHSTFSSGRTGNYYLESTDALNWAVTTASAPDIRGLNLYNVLTIVNGQLSGVQIAFDGTTYVTSALTRGTDLNSLVPVPAPPLKQGVSAVQNGSTIVQVGDTILTSTNNWQTFFQPVIPSGTGPLKSIRTYDGRFLAVGLGGTVVWSFDGVNWAKALSNTTEDLYDVMWSTNFWVAVGEAGRIIASANNGGVYALRNSGTGLPLYGVTSVKGAFVAVGADGLILTSNDTYEWVPHVTTDGKDLLAVTYGQNRYVATGTNGIVNVSFDGATWISTNIPGANVLSRVAYGNGTFLAIEANNQQVYFSPNGFTWTKVDVIPYSNGLPPAPWINGVDFTANRFLLSGDQSLLVEASPGFTVSPTLANGAINLNIQSITNGSHTIFSTSDIGGTNWQNRGSITVNGQATWTNSVSSPTMQFYRVRQD